MPQCQFPVFCCFVFQKSCIGNILGIGWNKSRSSYFTETKMESRGEMEKHHGAATPGHDAAQALAAPWGVVGPQAPTDLALPPIYSRSWEKPKHPSLHPRKVPSQPPSPTLAREGFEALPGTLPEREIITGGLYIAMPPSEVMRE